MFILIAFMMIFLGIIFMIFSISIKTQNTKRKHHCTVQVMAIIIDAEKRYLYHDMDDVSNLYWFPVYEYMVNGIKYRQKSNLGGKEPQIGRRTMICVNPYNPMEIYDMGNINGENAYKEVTDKNGQVQLCFTIVSIVLIIIGILLFAFLILFGL